MKRFYPYCMVTLFMAGLLTAGSLFAAEPELSGVLDSTVNYTAGAGDAPAHSFGLEEYANLRLRVKTGDKAAFFAAFNLIAVAGNYAAPALAFGTTSAVNYSAAMELERLYLRVNGDYVDTEAGLLRMNFGYGNVWGSSDFLNPRNPLLPNARPRGVLGIDASFYPADSLKLMGFIAGPKDPLEAEGGGFIPGISLDKHWDAASLQALYAFQTPLPLSENGIHRFGLSLKADLEIGMVADALYTLDPLEPSGIDGLSIGTGFDYSLLGGDLYVLFEYLFSGASSITAWDSATNSGSWKNHHFLYGGVTYRFNDYTSLGLAAVLCFDDFSSQPMLNFNYDIFQGLSLNLEARLPLDQQTPNGSRAGELGPLPPNSAAGAKFIFNALVRLRF